MKILVSSALLGFRLCQALAGLEIVACADILPERAQARAAEFNIRACSVEELLARGRLAGAKVVLMSHLGRVPTVGERFDIDGLTVEVLDAERRRVNRVRIVKHEAPVEAEPHGS